MSSCHVQRFPVLFCGSLPMCHVLLSTSCLCASSCFFLMSLPQSLSACMFPHVSHVSPVFFIFYSVPRVPVFPALFWFVPSFFFSYFIVLLNSWICWHPSPQLLFLFVPSFLSSFFWTLHFVVFIKARLLFIYLPASCVSCLGPVTITSLSLTVANKSTSLSS